MNPWTVLGWIVVGVVSTIVLILIAAFIYGVVTTIKEARDKRKAREEAARLEGLILPHFRTMAAGDMFSVNYQNWQIKELMTEYVPECNEHRLVIRAASVPKS
jgi:hypothetical protein